MNIQNFSDIDKILLAQNGRIIHQVWFTSIQNKKKTIECYNKLKIHRESWKIKNPTWFHFEWNQHLSDILVRTFFPEHYNMYKKYYYEIQRCDAIRYFFLYRYGGVYADMDYYCNKPLDDAFIKFNKDFYLVQSPNNGGEYVSNSLMMSRPKHPFWKSIFIEMEINKYCPIYYSRHMIVMYTTGPGLLTRVYNKYKIKYKLSSLPYKLFHPYGISDDIMSLKDSNAYAIHIGSGTWEKKDSKFLIYIYREWKIILFIILILLIPNLVYMYNQNLKIVKT